MTSRGRKHRGTTRPQDWDPMQEDYNDTTYDPQYADGDINGGVQLDHCRLYVKNINKALNEEGLYAAFAKYASNVRIFMSKDPHKRYAIATFDTPGEAKHAMMKLNKTEPLRLVVSIAHKKKYRHYQASSYDGSASGSSWEWRNRKREQHNGDNSQDFFMDADMVHLQGDFDGPPAMDPEQDCSQNELELKFKYHYFQAEAIKYRQLMLQSSQKNSSDRSVLPDGRIVIKNTGIQPPTQPASDNVFSSAAGDSSLPALQRLQKKECICCDSSADLFCGRCGVAPYCSPDCQQGDWETRHRDVCHNLLRTRDIIPEAKIKEPEIKKEPNPRICVTEIKTESNSRIREPEPKIKEPEPKPKISEPPITYDALRRPHSPATRNRDDHSYRPKQPHPQQPHPQQPHPPTLHPTAQKVNRNPNFKNYKNMRRPNVQNNNNKQDEELFNLQGPSETKPDKKNPAQEKPVQEDKPPQVEKHLSRSAQAMVKRPVPDHVTAKVETKPAAAAAAAPTTSKLVPKTYLPDFLSAGDTGILSVESDAASCKGKSGFICLILHDNSMEDYQKLCNEYLDDCEKDESYIPKPEELFSFKNPGDDSWYRARCLNKSLAALIDLGKLADLSEGSVCKKITPKYENIPEFCGELNAKGIKIGDSLKYTIISKSGSTCIVALNDNETNAVIGEGEITRWKPTVNVPISTPAIPEVQRPDLKNNSRVLLVDCYGWDKTFIRPADTESIKKFDMVINDTLESAKNAKPMKESPKKGQTVIAKFTDGYWYRALVKRTNESQNKYLLEYVEYGNIEINRRENIVACPQELTLEYQPTVVSQGNLKVTTSALTEAATEYIQKIRERPTELLLTLTDGSKVAPSGSDINLTVAKNKESMNKKLEELCTPEWKKLEVSGGDVIDTPRLMFSDLKYPSLPSSGCELLVLDTSLLEVGVINGCQRVPGIEQALEKLEQKLAEYCNSELGKQPYLPLAEELCIAQCPPYEQWYRAVLCEQVGGPGGSELQVCYIDYGNLATVPLSAVRKMLPEFLDQMPAASLHIEIRGFPKKPSNDILMKALLHMKVNDEGRGSLQVVSCVKLEPGSYIVDAPEMLAAINC